MNTVITSEFEILKASRKLIQQQGWSAINIRLVAAVCGVSVGSIYNYFDSKAALVEATVKSVWREIFHRSDVRWHEYQSNAFPSPSLFLTNYSS